MLYGSLDDDDLIECTLVECAVSMNSNMYNNHIANHVYYHETGTKQYVDKLIAGGEIYMELLTGQQIWTSCIRCWENKPQSQYIQGVNTIFFIHHNQVSDGAYITYTNIICDVRPLKNESHHICITMGGEKIHYEGELSCPPIFLIPVKNPLYQYVIKNSTVFC